MMETPIIDRFWAMPSKNTLGMASALIRLQMRRG